MPKIGIHTPVVSGSMDVSVNTAGIILCSLGIGLFVAGLVTLNRKKLPI